MENEEIYKAYLRFRPNYGNLNKEVILQTLSFETFKAGYEQGQEDKRYELSKVSRELAKTLEEIMSEVGTSTLTWHLANKALKEYRGEV